MSKTSRAQDPARARIEALGLAVRRARLEKGLSQEALGDAAGLDRTYISGIERGLRNTSIATLWRISDALEISLADLATAAEMLLPRRKGT